MIREAIEKILELSNAAVVTLNGVDYSTKPVQDVRKPDPQPDTLTIWSLTGFIDYVQSVLSRDGVPRGDLFIHVQSPTTVVLASKLYGTFRKRDVLATAKSIETGFKFADFIPVESFVIALQAVFVQSVHRDAVIKIIGTIKESDVRTNADDGMTQSVTAHAGMVAAKQVDIQNPFSLAPFRTFREISQPVSPFILRLQSGKNGSMPTCALFEADGGEWRLQAMRAILTYLRSYIDTNEIPVIA